MPYKNISILWIKYGLRVWAIKNFKNKNLNATANWNNKTSAIVLGAYHSV